MSADKFFGGQFGGSLRGFVGADQKPYLDTGDDGEKGGDRNQSPRVAREGFSVIGGSFFSRFWAYGLAGTVAGVLWVGLALWLNRDYPLLPPIESDQERKRRDG